MILNLILLAILFICVAMLGRQGIWNNVLVFFNTLFGALLATSHFERVANFLNAQLPTFTYLVDFVALWGLFALFTSLLQLATGFLSPVKMRIKKPADIAGGYLFSLWTAWILICFTTMTLHTAPLGRSFFGGTFQPTPEARMFFGQAPDRQWLALVHRLSQETFDRTPPAAPPGPGPRPGLEETEETEETEEQKQERLQRYVFDRDGEFIIKYAARRANFEREEGIRVRRDELEGMMNDE